MIVEVSYYFHTERLHIDNRYATSFLPERANPLFSTTLQFTLKYVSITFVQNLMTFPRRYALYNVESCKFYINFFICIIFIRNSDEYNEEKGHKMRTEIAFTAT